MIKYMEESEPWLLDLDLDLRNTLKEVHEELFKLDKGFETIKALDEIHDEFIEKFLAANDLTPSAEFRKQLTTPFALAKYIQLTIQQNHLLKRIKSELDSTFDKKTVSWVLHEDFKNQITFTKVLPVNSEEKPQSLLVKYRIDPETDKVIYTIMAGSWGWDIDKSLLKAIFEGKVSTSFTKNNTESDTNMSYNISDKNITITAGGIEIIVKKT